MFQTPRTKRVDRKDHVWYNDLDNGRWVCCLCGAYTCKSPPEYPTDVSWQAEGYKGLTNRERGMCPCREETGRR